MLNTKSLFLSLLTIVFIPFTCYGNIHEKDRTLTVNGETTLYKPADQLSITLGAITEGNTATVALNDNNVKMQEILSAIKSLGLTNDELQTQRFVMSPIYSTPPKNPGPEWQAKTIGYRVSNFLQINTGRLELAGKIIDAANKAGANSVENISYSLKDLRRYRAEAIASATKNAIDDAKALADSAGLALDEVIRIVLDPDFAPQPLYKSPMLYSVRAGSSGIATPLEAGDIEVKAKVNIVYRLGGPHAKPISSERNTL